MKILLQIIAISCGAVLGALLRWLISSALNPLLPALPLGTLAVNWLGGLIMGLALGFFALYPEVSSQWRLMLITGFLGSLTTFSAFSAEMAEMIRQQRFLCCTGAISLHVGGSILMVFAGMALSGLTRKFLAG